jgi:uncharacterized membrane protein YadS
MMAPLLYIDVTRVIHDEDGDTYYMIVVVVIIGTIIIVTITLKHTMYLLTALHILTFAGSNLA